MSHFETFMVSCEQRRPVRDQTLARLTATGWPFPVALVVDDEMAHSRLERISRTWRRALHVAAQSSARCVLLLEDDLIFGRWFTRNLLSWKLVNDIPAGGALFASLYNPGRPYLARCVTERWVVAQPELVWGSQALVFTPSMARYLERHWDEKEGNPDQRMPRLASRVTPVYLHLPSLVDHAPVPTTWGGMEHVAQDFDPEWLAPGSAAVGSPDVEQVTRSKARITSSKTPTQSPERR